MLNNSEEVVLVPKNSPINTFFWGYTSYGSMHVWGFQSPNIEWSDAAISSRTFGWLFKSACSSATTHVLKQSQLHIIMGVVSDPPKGVPPTNKGLLITTRRLLSPITLSPP